MSDSPAAAAPMVPEIDLGPPKWLSASFIESTMKDEFKVNSLDVENAVGVGENYATIVYRATASTTLGPISFIVKCVPESEFRKKMVEEAQFMTREIRMYKKTLPLFGGTPLSPNYPHCHFAQEDSLYNALILRDMRSLGYRTAPRHEGLDVEHCRLALTELAHLHGLSAALRIQQPEAFINEIYTHYKDMMYREENREQSEMFVKTLYPHMAESVRTNFPFRFREIADVIEGLVDTAFDDLRNDMLEAYLPENEGKLEDRVICLTHGDFWCNNMLFKYSEGSGKPEECMMIDFQISRCAAPVLDLFYFLYSSATQATRRAHMDELLQLYLDEALAALNVKGVTNPGKKFYKSVAEIKEDMKRHINFGFLFSCVLLPIVIADKSAAPDLDEMTEDSLKSGEFNPFTKMYSGARFIQRFTELLEDFDDLGYFIMRKALKKQIK